MGSEHIFRGMTRPDQAAEPGGVAATVPAPGYIRKKCYLTPFFQGLMISKSVCGKSPTLRVTNANPCVMAVAASKLSMAGKGRPAAASNRPQRSATSSSMGRTRAEKNAGKSVSSQSSSLSLRLLLPSASMPFRISPRVSTLMYKVVAGRSSNQASHLQWNRQRRSSDRTLVSIR